MSTDGVVSLANVKAAGKPVLSNDSAALWDIGAGITCLELKTKMNIFDSAIFDLIGEILVRVPQDFRGMVIGNEHARAFSAGASLALILERIRNNEFAALREFLVRGQTSFKALKYAPFPVVGAAFGLALGGGCEVLLHCDTIVAHADLNAGLPEVNVGLVPAWGGCTQLLSRTAARDRTLEPVAVAARVFEVIGAAITSKSAAQARDNCILREQDLIVTDRERLLGAARAEAIRLADNAYRPPQAVLLTLSGAAGREALMNALHSERAAGRATDTDVEIGRRLITVLTGAQADPSVPVGEDVIYALEADALVELAKTSATRARIEHLLATGKPLRN